MTMLRSPNEYTTKYKDVLRALSALHNDADFQIFIDYLKQELNEIAFDSCKEPVRGLAVKKQGAVMVIHEIITRAKEARNIFNKLQERMKKK